MDEDEFGLARLDKFARYAIDDLPRDLDNLFDEFSDFKTDDVAAGFRKVFVGKANAKQRYKVLEEMAPWVESV
jgi:hypothetical protein